MTATAPPALVPARRLSAEASALRERFPPRPSCGIREATGHDRAAVLRRLLAPPFPLGNASSQNHRKLGLARVLDWLGAQPGATWQERWMASGADGNTDWRGPAVRWLKDSGRIPGENKQTVTILGSGLLQLICGDVIRPGISWLLASDAPRNLAAEMGRVRDPAGFAALTAAGRAGQASFTTTRDAVDLVAVIVAAKGGAVGGITVGDCPELLEAGARTCVGGKSPYFCQLLHAAGTFPAGAPPTVRMFHPQVQGQLTAGQLIDRYDIACRPARDLLVDYLRERQPGVDYRTLMGLAYGLGLLFWKDLENHHPGIDSLRLAPDVAAAWKQRIQTKAARPAAAAGEAVPAAIPRSAVAGYLTMVRAFYLDIAQWAAEDPARWGPWAAPCPIRPGDNTHRKERSRRKSRMDRRTRERLPVLPLLAAAAYQARTDTAARLQAARAARPGELFTAAGQTLRRSVLVKPGTRIWGEDPGTAARRDLTREEDNAFWSWAAIEILRATGVRIEELTELSHHSLVQYQVPATGEVVPLLHIAPSKTDEERLLVVGPEAADVFAAILSRIRGEDGAVPLVAAYDINEKVWNPPMPLLFQHLAGLENRPIGIEAVRRLVSDGLAAAGLTDAAGAPLSFVPHDFRRIFATDAIMNGMPPHIAQLILGHKDINTTMGYKAVYPEEAINGHRAFIARRRELRPSEEYRTPTDAEWDEFLGHFERRKLALGDCGRAYGTACIHEHSCVRCALLRIDPAQRGRLEDIRENLLARIAEAEREGWTGEAEGLKVSLAAANNKLAQVDSLIARRRDTVSLSMPSFPDVAGRAAPAKEPE